MYGLPQTVDIQDKEYQIRNNGDFRTILDCLVALDDAELSEEERILSSIAIFYDDIKAIEDIFVLFNTDELLNAAVSSMYQFINGGELDEVGVHSNIKLVDWEQDEKLICAAVNTVAKCEIRAVTYMHWWTFLAYYMSVGDCTLTTVISIRNKIAKNKKLEKFEQEFRRDNPQLFKWKKKTTTQKEADDLFNELWNKSEEGGT